MASSFPVFEELPPEAPWGYYEHAAEPLFNKTAEGLRVAIFGSAWRGLHVLGALLREEMEHPSFLNIVGLATDDVTVEPKRKPRISAGKRLWQYMEPEERVHLQGFIRHLALWSGIDCYTGSVKIPLFSGKGGVLEEWKPDVIVMATFGQLIPPEVFRFPPFGMYNFHPSDLARGKYPGPDPFTEMMAAGESTTRMTCHHVDEGFDTGHVVGFSPEIPIQTPEGEYPDWEGVNGMNRVEALHYHSSPAAGQMAVELIRTIAQAQRRIDSLDFERCLDSWTLGPLSQPPKSRFHGVAVEIVGKVLQTRPDFSFGV